VTPLQVVTRDVCAPSSPHRSGTQRYITILPFVSPRLCAVSRLIVSLAQPGTTQREVVGLPH